MVDYSDELRFQIDDMLQHRFDPDIQVAIVEDNLREARKFGPTRMKIKFTCLYCKKNWTSTWGNILIHYHIDL